MDKEIEYLVSLLKQTFEKGAWHGPSVKESIEDVDQAQAFKRLPDTHSIIELVAHMTAWRAYTIRKLKGDAEYKVTDELNFPQAESWPETLRRLEESQMLLLSELETFPAGKLQEEVPGRANPLTFYMLLHGMIHHDVYHAGQIVLIKKANTGQSF